MNKTKEKTMVGGGGKDSESVEAIGLEHSFVLSPTMSSIPGLLTLCPSRAELLVAREPLHQLYTVEKQPFARYGKLNYLLLT